jgi:drug/metabolite transporter (DMT)-like permease
VSPVLTLLIALVAMSTSGPLVRLADAHPLAIATLRLAMTLVVVSVALTMTGTWHQLRRLSVRDLAVAVGSGVFLALHFWSWMASLALTTVAASTVLVSLQPLFVAAGSGLFLGEHPARGQWIGIAIAVVGAIIIGLGAAGEPGAAQSLLGNLLALLGAVAGAAYVLAGRRLRSSLDLWPCVGIVYSVAMVTLVLFVIWQDVPLLPQPSRTWWTIAAMALGPMLLGHTLLNYALRYLPAHVVNLTSIGEPVGATLLAWWWLSELPSQATLIGGLVAVAGLVVAGRASVPRDARPRATAD